MRTLPWLKNTDGESVDTNTRQEVKDEITESEDESAITEVETAEQGDESETEDEEDDFAGDNAADVMRPGYEADDAYIMVEHDLLEAAKQLTRHIHLAAYQKNAAAPMPEIHEIQRPTTGPPKIRPLVEGISDDEVDTDGKDSTTLGELLRRRPVTKTFAVTPLKRKERSPGHPNTAKENRPISNDVNFTTSTTRDVTKGAELDAEDDTEDDEDLARPLKKVYFPHPSLSHVQMAKIVSTSSTSSMKSSKPPEATAKISTKLSTRKSTSSTLDPDWIFSGLWTEDVKSVKKPFIKREKVSLATQLEESSLKIMGKKKPISLKDQFKFLDS
jgi:hypothetical protein